MTLKQLLKAIGEMGYAQRLINYSIAGTSLDQVNGMEITWYPLLFSSPTATRQVMEKTTTFDITLYYIDRLLTDYSNDIDVFSSAIENLKNLINGIKDIPGVLEVMDSYTIRNFTNTEKMNDSLAGAYAQIKIKVANDDLCLDE